jgi:hypothetical protein
MVQLLKDARVNAFDHLNLFASQAKLVYMDSVINDTRTSSNELMYYQHQKALALLELGNEDDAISILESMVTDESNAHVLVLRDLAIAYLRQGERNNCITSHAAESCILPIRGMAIHRDTTGAAKALRIYEELLSRNPNDLESRWLLNVAYMTLGKYPFGVSDKYLIPGMNGDTSVQVNAFTDIAADLALDVTSMGGGSITEDFDNDGYLDIVISGFSITEQINYFRNNGDGTFTNNTIPSGLSGITGGLNLMQADYDNDGFKDILVLRGGWQGSFGKEPNSLLKNNGDGTFTDVTIESGLLSFHPTQTATWNDFNNDGWLDVFIGNESTDLFSPHPCELYINNQDGTFEEIAARSGCNIIGFVKGVTSGDYDHDNFMDIFVSTMNGKRILLKNMGEPGVSFRDVTNEAGLDGEDGNSFPTWFWDYNNDGWLDIFACDYSFRSSLASYAAAEKLGMVSGNPEKMLLYHNNKNGTFTNVADEVGLNKVTYAMGSNFGDIDNDGFLDIYLGTGNPSYQSVLPNKMYKNIGGKRFADVTTSARTGHLQKGHGTSFADMDNDGDQDIYIEMGGAYPGDAYQNAFFLNPGQGSNNWTNLQLEGTIANRDAIGSTLKLYVTDNGSSRIIYRDVNSGGSFGCSPLRREIGLGKATVIDKLEIYWHGSNKTETFKNLPVNKFLYIKEGEHSSAIIPQKTILWALPEQLCE